MADYQDILKRAIQIRDAVLEGTNTASLVGGVMVDTLYLSRKLETTINQVIKSIKELGGSGGTGGGSIDENTLAAYLINNGYAKLTDIPSSWWGQTANANNVVQGSMSQVLSLLFTNETIALDGIANEDTPTDSKTKIVTPNYVNDKFIPRKEDANVLGSLTFDKIQKFLRGMKVGANGDWTLDELDNTHLTTDYLQVRMKAIFETLEILHTDTSGGELFITPVGSNRILKVEEVNVTYDGVSQKAYRCYFLGEQDGSKVENKWKVGDQARSKSFNLTQGKYHNVGNHYYWRLVIGVSTETVEIDGKKYHYVDLSDIDKDAASDEPMVDDILNQCGNRTDNARQSCLVFSAVDTYSPSVTLYHGVNGYTFNNKEYVDYGVNHSTGKAFFHVYGDMYFGDRPTSANNYEGESYVKYDSDKKKVTIKGDLDIKSTYDGKTLDKYIADNSLDKNAVETIIKKSETITDLQNQIDGAIETWFYDGVPTLKTEPAIGWTTDTDKKTHLGDLYYDNKTGKAYRFAKDGSTYKWIIITDTELTKALEDSSQALKDAKSKRRIFGSQPVPPYDVNDMWVNATYPSDGSTYKNEILKCSTSKAEGEEFDIADWKLASKYTDDTKAEEAKKAAEKAQAEIKDTQTNLITLGTTVSNNKKAFDAFTSDGYLDSSEIAAIAQDSKRLEDDYNAAVESYNNVVGSKFLLDKDGNETTYKTDLVSAKATLDSAKNGLIHFLSDIVSRYNASDSDEKAAIKVAAAQKYTNFTNAYKAFYDKLGVANNYITSNLFEGLNTKLITNMAGLEYIKAALVDGRKTEIKGGLILSTLIALRNEKGDVTSGINGADTKENGIALWLGGKAIDRQASTTKEDEMDSAAKSLLRFDGTGYFANGNLWWDADGILHADPTSFIINKNNVGVQLALFAPVWKSGTTDTTKLANVLAIDPQKPFTHLDVSGNITTEGSLKIGGVYLSWDSDNNALRLSKDAAGKEAANFYALGGITAYGKGSSTTGGGGGLNGSVMRYSDALKLTSESLSEVASAYSIKALDSRISSLEGGSAMNVSVSGSGNAVTAISKSGTTISVTKGTTFLTSHQSLASYLTKTDAASLYQPKGNYLTAHQSLDGYLKLSGGAMTGDIRYKGSKSTNDMIKFVDNNADTYGNGICIGGGGLTIIGGGESADIVLSQHTSGGDENMIVANDDAIDFFSNVQNGWNSRKAGSFDTSGYWNGAGFKKDNSSDSYVLLGGGGHKAISSLSVNYASSAESANSVAWSNVSGRPTKLSQLTNDKNFVTGSVSGQTITINGVSTTWQNTWRGITDSYSGTSTGTSLSQKGANSLYNDLHNGYASSAGNADTVDGYHANSSNAPYGHIPTIQSDGVMEVGKYIDFHDDNSGKHDFSTRLLTTGNYGNSVNLPSNNGTLALTSDNVASATKLQTPRTIWGQSFDGTGNVDGTIYINNNNSSNGAIRLNNDISANARISAIDDQVIFNTGNAIRFGETAWDWNQWAGLKYNHSKKTIYLGIADGSVFNANSAQTGGMVNLVNCSLKVDNTVCVPYNTMGISFRSTEYAYWGSWLSHQSAENEALVIASQNDNTAIMFVNGESYANISNSRFQSLTPALMIKNNIVQLGYSYNDFSGDYRLRVKGSTYIHGDLYTTSNILAKGGVTAYSSSDIRLKTDLRKLDYLGIIKAMGGTFGFAWKKDNTRSIGFIAQHVLCNPHFKDIVETDEKGYYKINYWSPKLIATAFGAIEQVDDEVTRLKKKVKTLENRVKELEIK
nr:MAG TPA: Putative tail protein [Caudoviricetes sp.]